MKINELTQIPNGGDMFAHGRYVAYRLANKSRARLLEFVEPLDIPGRLESDTWHITLVMSREDFPWTPEGRMSSYIRIDKSSLFWEFFPRKLQDGSPDSTGSLVLRCKNGYLDHRYAKAIAAGAKSDFPEYKQHISMSYTYPADADYSSLPLPNFDINLESEYQEPLEE